MCHKERSGMTEERSSWPQLRSGILQKKKKTNKKKHTYTQKRNHKTSPKISEKENKEIGEEEY